MYHFGNPYRIARMDYIRVLKVVEDNQIANVVLTASLLTGNPVKSLTYLHVMHLAGIAYNKVISIGNLREILCYFLIILLWYRLRSDAV